MLINFLKNTTYVDTHTHTYRMIYVSIYIHIYYIYMCVCVCYRCTNSMHLIKSIFSRT